jgi:hypothetical protein
MVSCPDMSSRRELNEEERCTQTGGKQKLDTDRQEDCLACTCTLFKVGYRTSGREDGRTRGSEDERTGKLEDERTEKLEDERTGKLEDERTREGGREDERTGKLEDERTREGGREDER